jgi:hypothetical protein
MCETSVISRIRDGQGPDDFSGTEIGEAIGEALTTGDTATAVDLIHYVNENAAVQSEGLGKVGFVIMKQEYTLD